MRIATWNVNSLKARLEKVRWWLDRARPEVLPVQETKLADAAAPVEVFRDAGYELAHHGEGRWNGVAIASRLGVTGVVTDFGQALRPASTADSFGASGATAALPSEFREEARRRLPPALVGALREIAEGLLASLPSLRIILFGSRATGRGGPRSDFDLGFDAVQPLDARVTTAIRERIDDLPRPASPGHAGRRVLRRGIVGWPPFVLREVLGSKRNLESAGCGRGGNRGGARTRLILGRLAGRELPLGRGRRRVESPAEIRPLWVRGG